MKYIRFKNLVVDGAPAGTLSGLREGVILLQINWDGESEPAFAVLALVLLADLQQPHAPCFHYGAHDLHKRRLILMRINIMRPICHLIVWTDYCYQL